MRIGWIGVIGIIVLVLAGGLGFYFVMNSPHEYHEVIPYKKNLPEKPDDFSLMKRALHDGRLPPANISSNYYLQPDFYPNWRKVKNRYENHDYSRWGVYGHGAYPSNPTITFENRSVGTWIDLITFYRTGYGIETYQGLKLIPEKNEYFDVDITPNQMLLTPTFPQFSKDWVRKIHIRTTIKKEPPAGTYRININAGQVDKKLANKWYWKALRKNTTKKEKKMVDAAEMQAKMGNEPPQKFKKWIKIGRKNKYVDAGMFNVGPRIRLRINVQ